MKLQGVVLANQAIGMAVTDESNNRIGDVQDIVIDPTNCKLLYVVISFNGGTTGGTSLVPVPPTVFQLSGDGRSLVVANANTVLSGAPHFTTDQFPFTLTKDWDKEVKTYWQTHGGSNSTTP
jgi:sporulation protein YlmC with PRC-barrel domain